MKRIGIVGGLGPETTLYYYRALLDISYQIQGKYSGLEVVIYNLNNQEVEPLMFAPDKSAELATKLNEAIQHLQQAGADFAIIACNTAHIVFDAVNARSSIPLLSIVEETCKAVKRLNLTKVGLFGSNVTMQSGIYPDAFLKKGIDVSVPKIEEQAYIAKQIKEELLFGIVHDATRQRFLKIVQRMINDESIQGLILGCTEIPLLLGKVRYEIPFFDTAKIHAESALRYSLSRQ